MIAARKLGLGRRVDATDRLDSATRVC